MIITEESKAKDLASSWEIILATDKILFDNKLIFSN